MSEGKYVFYMPTKIVFSTRADQFVSMCIGEATSMFFSEHRDVFVNKNTLQLKIREVRQKMMQQQNDPLAAVADHSDNKPHSPMGAASLHRSQTVQNGETNESRKV